MIFIPTWWSFISLLCPFAQDYNPETVFSETILSIDRHIDFRKIYYLFYIRMGSVGCLAKGDIFFWQNILKNRSKYRGDISEQSVVYTVLIPAIIIEIFRKNIPISYIIPYKKLASPLIHVCLKKSHMCAPSEDSDRLGIRPVWSEFSLSAWRKLGF